MYITTAPERKSIVRLFSCNDTRRSHYGENKPCCASARQPDRSAMYSPAHCVHKDRRTAHSGSHAMAARQHSTKQRTMPAQCSSAQHVSRLKQRRHSFCAGRPGMRTAVLWVWHAGPTWPQHARTRSMGNVPLYHDLVFCYRVRPAQHRRR